LAPDLCRVVDPIACGDLAERVRDAVAVFTEVEALLDRVANRLLDLAGEPDSGLDPAIVKLSDDIWLYGDLTALDTPRVAPAFAATLADVDERALRQFRTLAMSMLVAVRRACTELGEAIVTEEASPERDAAASVHTDLLSIAQAAAIGEDPRHPFQHLWPRLVATGFVSIAVERVRHHAARAS
jgi:hypothetical protein